MENWIWENKIPLVGIHAVLCAKIHPCHKKFTTGNILSHIGLLVK